MKLLINEMDANTIDTNRLNDGTNNMYRSKKQRKIRVLVSGASGFIGQRLVRRLLISPSTTNGARGMTRKPIHFPDIFRMAETIGIGAS